MRHGFQVLIFMIKIIFITVFTYLIGCSALTNTDTQLKSQYRASQGYTERSLDSKTLNVRCSMPAFCCVQYEDVVIDGKEHKSIVGLCVGI